MRKATCRECDLLTSPNGPEDSGDVHSTKLFHTPAGQARAVAVAVGALPIRASRRLRTPSTTAAVFRGCSFRPASKCMRRTRRSSLLGGRRERPSVGRRR
jgi:hypothetical protein